MKPQAIWLLSFFLSITPVFAQTNPLGSLLQIAVENNNVHQIDSLISEGANIEYRFDTELAPTALMYASAFADGAALKSLLTAGADVNAVDTNGDPALNWATYYGHINNMQSLLQAGADLSLRSRHGDALDVAFRLWHDNAVIQTFVGTELEQALERPAKQLFELLQTADYDRLKRRVERGLRPDQLNGLGQSALEVAIRSGQHDLLELLLQQGANPNLLNRVGQSALSIAARRGDAQSLELLLAHEADPNHSGSEYALNPLIGAAVNGDPAIIESLLTSGAAIDQAEVINQATALHWALFRGNSEAAQYLLQRGADYRIACLDGSHTAFTLALATADTVVQRQIEDLRTAENALLGSWQLEEIHYIYPDTTYRLRAHQGSLIIQARRYSIMYNPGYAPRTPFKNLSQPTEAELIAGFRSVVFNSGPYDLYDDVLLAIPDIAKVPGFENGRQYYRFELAGDHLQYRLYDETYPNGDKPEWYGHLEIRFHFKRE